MMIITLSAGDATAVLLRYGSVLETEPYYADKIIFFQVVANQVIIRAFQYALRTPKRPLLLTHDGYSRRIDIVPGKWLSATKPVNVQGIPLYILSAYAPIGMVQQETHYFFVLPPLPPDGGASSLFRRWAEEYTPYPIPLELDIDTMLPFTNIQGRGYTIVEDEDPPRVIAISAKRFAALLPFVEKGGTKSEA